VHILVSNDDGYLSEGILALANAMKDFGEVSVFAPEVDRSGSSNSLTLDRPLRVKKTKTGFFYVNGTPTDCVHLAATILSKNPPDFVVSGINCGRNVAEDVHYSGTVAAAMEGFMLNIPSVAFSLDSGDFKNLSTASEVSKMLISKLISNPLAAPVLFNVNIPNVPLKDFMGFAICKPGHRMRAKNAIESKSPRGETIYWVGPVGNPVNADEIGTEFYALENRQASITTLKTNLYDENATKEVKNWFEKF
jgi:5'-nucleotidase